MSAFINIPKKGRAYPFSEQKTRQDRIDADLGALSLSKTFHEMNHCIVCKLLIIGLPRIEKKNLQAAFVTA